MSWPILKYRTAKIEARRGLSNRELVAEEQKDLRFWTNFGIAVAILVGVAVIVAHRGVITAGIAAYGAALGSGGVLGFLFGVPGSPKAPVNIRNAGTVDINTGNGSRDPAAQVDQGAKLDPNAAPAPQAAAAQAPAPALVNPPAPAPAPTDAAPPIPVPPDTASTSNLEQVADWVTKLLLGGGLTQMQRIPPMVWRWARIVALGIIGSSTKPLPDVVDYQQAFAAGLLVYGFILGFFAGFLITKLQLGKAIV